MSNIILITKQTIVHFFNIVIAFGLIFDLSFASFPSLTTGRISIFILIMLYWNESLKLLIYFIRQNKFESVVFLFLIPFSLSWLAFNGSNDSVMFSRALWFVVYCIFGAFLYIRMCRMNLSLAMTYYLAAIVIQALLVFKSVLSPEFRSFVDQILVNSGNIDFNEGVRFSGFSNGGGATLSLQLSLGVVSAFVLFAQSNNLIKKLCLLFIAIVITISTIFVARTGLYISLLTLIAFLLFHGRSLLIPISLVISVYATFLCSQAVNLGEIRSIDNNIRLDRTVDWAFDLFLRGESNTADALVAGLSNVRELTFGTLLFGSGRVSEPDGTNYSRYDSGYIHLLYALGLPLSLIFYFALFLIYWKMLLPVHGQLKVIGIALILFVFILEIKEPFIFKYTLPFFVLVYAYLAGNRQFVQNGCLNEPLPQNLWIEGSKK